MSSLHTRSARPPDTTGDTDHLHTSRFGGMRDRDPTAERPWYNRVPPISSIIIVIMAMLVSGWLVAGLPPKDYVDHDFPPGATGHLLDLDIAVVDITAAQTIDGTSTGGLFLILQVTVTNHGIKRDSIKDVEVITPDGKTTYRAGGESIIVDPDFRSTSYLPVVVDPNRLPGLRLRLDNRRVYTFRDPRVVMDLGIDDARAQQLRAIGTGRVVTLPDPEVVGVP